LKAGPFNVNYQTLSRVIGSSEGASVGPSLPTRLDFDGVVSEANRLPYGLAANAYSSDSGSEAIEAYLNTKFVSQVGL
jgi:hypothetical protein